MRIFYEDDLVIVKDGNGEVIYKGIEDDEPMKYEAWKYNEKEDAYHFGEYTKVCVG